MESRRGTDNAAIPNNEVTERKEEEEEEAAAEDDGDDGEEGVFPATVVIFIFMPWPQWPKVPQAKYRVPALVSFTTSLPLDLESRALPVLQLL
ncbi:hypothetical protein ACFX1R_046948 [Malus domestica]